MEVEGGGNTVRPSQEQQQDDATMSTSATKDPMQQAQVESKDEQQMTLGDALPRAARRRSSSAHVGSDEHKPTVTSYSGTEEKRKRHPEFLNSVPRFYELNNDLLMSEVWEALHKGQRSWLNVQDVVSLLEFCRLMKLGARAPHRPPSGTIFYFDSRAGEYFRRDGYDYVKKKGSITSVREDHVKLRQGAMAIIYASYVHSAEWIDEVSSASMFHRRSYWLVNSDEKDRGVIVHYLGDTDSQIEPVIKPHEELCECILCCIKRENSRPDPPGESLEQILSRVQHVVKTRRKRLPPPSLMQQASSTMPSSPTNAKPSSAPRKKRKSKNGKTSSDEESDNDSASSSAETEEKLLMEERRRERESRRRAAAPKQALIVSSSSDDDSDSGNKNRRLPAAPPLAYRPATLSDSTAVRPVMADKPASMDEKLEPLPERPWKEERWAYGFQDDDQHAAALASAIDTASPLLPPLSTDVVDMDPLSLLTPIHSRRVSTIDNDHRVFDIPLTGEAHLEPIFVPGPATELPFSMEKTSEPMLYPLATPQISMLNSAAPLGHSSIGVPSSAAHAKAGPSEVNGAGSGGTMELEPNPLEQPIGTMAEEDKNSKSKGKKDKSSKAPSSPSGKKKEPKPKVPKDPVTLKPQTRFDFNNLLIVDVSPARMQEKDKVLVIIGMAKNPETFNHRTWTEKVLPRMSIHFGDYRLPEFDNVALGVVRFSCPPAFRQSTTLPKTTSANGYSPFEIFIENLGRIPFKMDPLPCWDVDGDSSKRFRASTVTPIKDVEPQRVHKRRFSSRSPIHSQQQHKDGFFPADEDEEVEELEEEELDRTASNMVERVVRLMTSSAQVNSAEIINEVSPDNGFNFLHTAVFCGASPEIVQMLLQHGADPNAKTKDSDGNTALHLACEQGNVALARVLIAAGADPNILNDQGFSLQEMIMCREEDESDAELFMLLGDPPATPAIKPSSSSSMVMESPNRRLSSASPRPITPQRPASLSLSGSENPLMLPSAGGPVGSTHMALLREALSGLSLKEQYTLTLAVHADSSERKQRRSGSVASFSELNTISPDPPTVTSTSTTTPMDIPDEARTAAAGDVETAEEVEEAEDDVTRVVSENQPHVLAAMSDINHSEKAQLDLDARKIQSNVRAWLLRRQNNKVNEAAIKVQALAKGHLARRHFQELREKASATLVIQKSLRAHIKAKRLAKQQQQQQQQPMAVDPDAATPKQQRLTESRSSYFSVAASTAGGGSALDDRRTSMMHGNSSAAEEFFLSSDHLIFDDHLKDDDQ